VTKEKNLEGIGGWLLLVGLSIVISPIGIINIFPIYIDIGSHAGAWERVIFLIINH
jgi:hypothetical protein